MCGIFASKCLYNWKPINCWTYYLYYSNKYVHCIMPRNIVFYIKPFLTVLKRRHVVRGKLETFDKYVECEFVCRWFFPDSIARQWCFSFVRFFVFSMRRLSSDGDDQRHGKRRRNVFVEAVVKNSVGPSWDWNIKILFDECTNSKRKEHNDYLWEVVVSLLWGTCSFL